MAPESVDITETTIEISSPSQLAAEVLNTVASTPLYEGDNIHMNDVNLIFNDRYVVLLATLFYLHILALTQQYMVIVQICLISPNLRMHYTWNETKL
jgi:hypothetical protein